MFASLLSDLRYALRQMRRTPVLTITAILTLGLGIGATTAVFSLIYAVMLKSLPVQDPGALYRIGAGKICCYASAPEGEWGVFSYDFYERLRRESAPEFDQVAAFQAKPDVVSVRHGSHQAQAQALICSYVSGNYFQTLGIRPFVGRLFTFDDDTRNAAPTIVLSYHAWQRDFGGSPSIIGATVTVENMPFTVVGVTPPGFYGETLTSTPPSLWVTLRAEYLTDGNGSYNLVPSSAWLRIIGRLHPGASPAVAAARLTAMLRHWLVTDAAMMPDNRAELLRELPQQNLSIDSAASGIGMMRDSYGSSLGILLGICALVLLIACANVANLLLARGLSRRPQTAIRSALGASRQRLVRQALTESLLLGALGGIAGILIAFASARLLVLLTFRQAGAIHVGLSWPMLAACFALALLSGVLFGTIPAWLLSRANPIDAVRGFQRTTTDGTARLRQGLVVLQTAVSIALLAGASMLTRSLLKIEHQDFGFQTQNRISIIMEPPLAVYTADHLNVLYRELEQKLRALPGVEGASVALYGPLSASFHQTIVKPGEGIPRTDGSQSAMWDRISPGYFATVGQHLVRGRDFTDSDNQTTRRVAVVNQAFVRRFFPGEDPMGKLFGFATPENSASFQIVGVVKDAKYLDPDRPAMPMVFAPLAQTIVYKQPILQDDEKWSHFIASAQVWTNAGELGAIEPRIREAFRQVDPNFAITRIQTMQEQVDVNFDQQRLLARLSGLFGALALLLASIGLYGVMAYSVTQRTNEIGIRMAIGANRMHIAALILRSAFAQILLGLALGIPIAMVVGRLLRSRLYELGAVDPLSLLLPTGVLLLCALIASALPARHAASIEPLEALRNE
jgi:predicted permease